MPYNPAGLYSLIASYFARPGQTIRTEQHNPVLEDIGSALSNVLVRDGRAPMTGQLRLADSGWSFSTEPTLGMYRKASGVIGIAGGVLDGSSIASGLATIDLTQAPYNLSLSTPTIDQSDIIQQACDDFEGQGVNLVIPANGTPIVGIASTIMVPRGVTLQGGNGYGGNAQSDENFTGATLSWVGGNGGTMVHLLGVNHSAIYGLCLDGNDKTEMIGLHLSSVNDPPQSYTIIKHFTIKNCFKSIVLSDPGDTSYAPDGTDPNNIGRAQNDSLFIEDFTIFGDETDGSTGIHINGTNVAQSSLICRGNIQSVDYGIRVIQTNGNFKLQQLNGGSPAGSHKTFIRYEASLAVPPMLEQCETEGAWLYSVHDSSYIFDGEGVAIYAPYTQTWINCQFNGKILIDGTARITSINNSGGSPLAEGFEWVAGGQSFVWSIGDTNPLLDTDYTSPWQTADNGQVAVIGDRSGIMALFAGQVAAGSPPGHLKFLKGALSSSTGDNSGDSSRIFLGNSGDRYIAQSVGTTWVEGSNFCVGGVPSGSPNEGDIVAMRDATHGAIIFGGDMSSSVFRDGDDVKIAGPGTGALYYNGQIITTGTAGASVVTLTGTQTLTNKTLTAPHITGVTTNSDATAGEVGEYVEGNGTLGSVTTATAKNITSISLTAGDWDVEWIAIAAPSGTTNITQVTGSVSQTSASHSFTTGDYAVIQHGSAGLVYGSSNASTLTGTKKRISLASTTTIYLVGSVSFTVSTCQMAGKITARRVR